MSAMDHLRAASSLAVIAINLLVWCVPLFVLSVIKAVIPAWREPVAAAMEWIYRAAVRIDDAWLRDVVGVEWEVPDFKISPDDRLVVISNHVCWADILLLQSLVCRRGPVLKFLTKRELVAIPIFGIIFWAFEFPLLQRSVNDSAGEDPEARRRRDLEAVSRACAALDRRPGALVNFAEGTRFTEAKRIRSGSPFERLLRPRTGGFSAILDGVRRNHLRVLDVTLDYHAAGRHAGDGGGMGPGAAEKTSPPDSRGSNVQRGKEGSPSNISFWRFLAGRLGRIEIGVEVFAGEDLPERREERARWLDGRWRIKDQRLIASELESAPRSNAHSRA